LTTRTLTLAGSVLRSRQGTLANAAATPAARSAPNLLSALVGYTERRHSPRRWGNPVEVVVTGPPDGGAPERAWIMNRSAGGLRLSATQPVEVGRVVRVRASGASDDVPWVAVEIKACAPVTGRWALGCAFAEPPADEVLALFR
jgi:hypothetical protein